MNAEKGKEKTLVATINIINGINIHVVGKIYGSSVHLLDASTLQKFATAGNTNKPKTVTVVYGHNSTQTRNRKVNLGYRQNGDKLIAFQSKNVTFAYRFAETEFEFHDQQRHITCVGFSFDVSNAIKTHILYYLIRLQGFRFSRQRQSHSSTAHLWVSIKSMPSLTI